MQAFAYAKHGDCSVLQAQSWAEPKLGRTQVLVRVHAMALNPLDYRLRNGELRVLTGLRFPRLIGSDFSGTIEAVGRDVSDYDVGDTVCGMLRQIFDGVSADVIAVNASQIAPAPPSLDLTTAAAVPLAALTAYQALTNLVNVQSGTRVLVNGASGGVGTFATQIAADFGANVTAVTSFRNTDWMESLGAAETIDYTQTDFTQCEARYDVVFDCYGNKPYPRSKSALTKSGTYISTIPAPHTYGSTVLNPLRRHKSKVVVVQPKGSDLKSVTRLIESGSVRPIVDTVFERDGIHAAYEKLESKRAKGKIVVRLNPL